MNLFRFEALGLLPKRKETFDGIRWDGQAYREIQVGMDELHELADKATAYNLVWSDLNKSFLVIFRKQAHENPIYLIPDARRAKPLRSLARPRRDSFLSRWGGTRFYYAAGPLRGLSAG